jgi:uncharacterized integral membrane protein
VRGTLVWLVFLLLVVTIFAISNLSTVTVNFWQVTVYTGPLALVVVGAGVLGALLTYLASILHHIRQSQHIRALEHRVRTQDAQQVHTGASPSTEETHSLP